MKEIPVEMVSAYIHAIECYLPSKELTNDDLNVEFPDWDAMKIAGKTGIAVRHIAAEGECASDLAFQAAGRLFDTQVCSREEVDFLILCTQSPDYYLPATACILQHRLGLPRTIGAVDITQGCSGYVQGLGLAKGLIETGQAGTVLLLTAETYSKYLSENDRSVRTIFGDGATATLVKGQQSSVQLMGPFRYGTDGSGARHLVVTGQGVRHQFCPETVIAPSAPEGACDGHLHMNGPEVFNFSLKRVPAAVADILQYAGLSLEQIDRVVFHQANKYMLEHLRNKIRIPEDKFSITMQDVGNTVSGTIPLALRHDQQQGKLKRGDVVLLVSFGVGFSWNAAILRWMM